MCEIWRAGNIIFFSQRVWRNKKRPTSRAENFLITNSIVAFWKIANLEDMSDKWWSEEIRVQIQNRLTKPAQHRVQADVLPRSVSRHFSARKTFSVSWAGSHGNTQLTQTVGKLSLQSSLGWVVSEIGVWAHNLGRFSEINPSFGFHKEQVSFNQLHGSLLDEIASFISKIFSLFQAFD